MSQNITGLFSKEVEPDPEEADFLRRLRRTNAGRWLADHIANTLNMLRHPDQQSCPMQQVSDHTRLFFWLLSRSLLKKDESLPFCLPSPLPKYIGIYDLSGKRSVLYSQHPSLIRVMSFTSSVCDSMAHMQQLEKLILYAEAHESHRVLIVLSMPWQAGISAASWEARTFCVSPCPDGNGQSLEDGQLAFSEISCCACKSPPSVVDGAPYGSEFVVIPKSEGKAVRVPCLGEVQAKEFAKSMVSVDLDVKTDAEVHSVEDNDSETIAKLKSLCTRLHADVTTQRELLAASQAEAKALKHSAETYKEELWENRSAAEEAMVEAASLQKRSLEMQISKMRSSLCQTSEELVLKTEELEKTRYEKAKFEKATAASKKLQDAQIATFNDTISSLTQTNSHLDAKVKRLNSEMEGLRAKLEEEMELRKTAQAKVAEKTMFLNAMQTHMEESERKKSEHEGLLSDNSSLKKEIVSLQSQLEENRRQSLELDLAVTRKVEEASTFMEDLKNTQECCTKLQKENATLKKQNKKYIKLSDGPSPSSEDRAGGKADACTSTNEEVALGTNPYVEIARLIDRVKELEAAVASASSSTSTCTSRACEERGDNNQEARSTASPSPVSFERSEPTSRATLPVAPVSEETRPRPPCYYEFVSPDTSLAAAARRADLAMRGLSEWLRYEGIVEENWPRPPRVSSHPSQQSPHPPHPLHSPHPPHLSRLSISQHVPAGAQPAQHPFPAFFSSPVHYSPPLSYATSYKREHSAPAAAGTALN